MRNLSQEDVKKVIIDLEETEETEIGEHSEQLSIAVEGVLTVNNVSEQHRIWNTNVDVSEGRDSTDFDADILHVGEVNPQDKWSTNYGVKAEAPILTLSEVFDACRTVESEDPHYAYVYGFTNPVKFTITLKNEIDVQIDNIVLKKTIPPEITTLKIENASVGNAVFDEENRVVTWSDFILFPGESATLELVADAEMSDVSVKNAGEIVVTYKAENAQKSKLNPDLTALTEVLVGIDKEETEPNHWVCTLEFENTTDILVRLDKAEVFYTDESGNTQKMIDEEPHLEIPPGEHWSKSFELDSKNPPECSHNVVHTPVRTITKRVIGTIKKVAQSVPVYRVELNKVFDPPEVNSFDKTPVDVTLEAINAGTAPLNQVIIIDTIPEDVMPPKKEHITIMINDKEYDGEFDFVLDPDDENPENAHIMTITLNLTDDWLLQPDQKIVVSYAIMAWKPRPEKTYPAPLTVKGNVIPAGLHAEVSTPEEEPKLLIKYRRRRISAFKGINKGSQSGQFVIPLRIENRGEVTIENVVVKDWIPKGYKLVSVEPEDLQPETQDVEDGTLLIWKFVKMFPGDKKEIKYVVEGEGEYERRDPEVSGD